MAVQEKSVSSTGSDLDALIHSLEYENQHHVKMIEKENQRRAYLESQEEEKQQVIADLQTQITNLEMDTKNNHRQFVHNKNTLESLKKSKCVLQAHKDALLKQLDTLQHENSTLLRELEEAVKLYEKTWMDYEAQYKSLSLYQQLLQEEQRLAQSQAEQCKWQHCKDQLQTKIRVAQDELDFRDWYRFCIKIAEKWVMISRKKEELLAGVREKETLQAKLKEIREKNTSAVTTPVDSSQDMETDSSQGESSEKEAVGGNPTEEDLTLVTGDGGDNHHGDVEAEKQSVGTEQQVSNRREMSRQVSFNNQTFIGQHASDKRVPSVIPLSNISPLLREGRMGRYGDKIQERRHRDDPDRFEPCDTSSPVVSESRAVTRRLLQPPQLTSTPRMTYQPPTLALPKIRMGVQQRHYPRLPVSVPQIISMSVPRKVVPATISQQQSGSGALAPANKLRPPRMSVPLLRIPRPSPPPSPRIPSVRSAVSSILSSAKRVPVEKSPRPLVPSMSRVPLPPRMLQLVPPPLPALSRFSHHVDKGQVLQNEHSRPAPPSSASSGVTMPAVGVGEKGHNAGDRSNPWEPAGHIPTPLKANSKQGCTPSSEAGAALTESTATPELVTPGAGDAPSATNATERTGPPSTDHGPVQKDSTKSISQDEEMESDTDTDPSQPQSSSQLSDGHFLSQGRSVSFSPFDLDKHKQMLLEMEDSGDSFNFQQRNLFSTNDNDKMEDQSPQRPTAASSILSKGFAKSSSVSKGQPKAPLFKDVTSLPSVSNPVAPGQQPPPVNRDQERGGSFFSFEAMDTSEPSAGGLNLLSIFGNGIGDKEGDPEPAFSFNFGTSSTADSGNGSGFSFTFGKGGDKEETGGSMFSLF